MAFFRMHSDNYFPTIKLLKLKLSQVYKHQILFLIKTFGKTVYHAFNYIAGLKIDALTIARWHFTFVNNLISGIRFKS